MRRTKKKTVSDPFDLSLDEYLRMEEDQKWGLTRTLYDRYADWIQDQFQKTSAALLVLCDGKVIYSSFDRYDFKADEVAAEMEQQQQKPCFILTRPLLVEESTAWSESGGIRRQGSDVPIALSNHPKPSKASI